MPIEGGEPTVGVLALQGAFVAHVQKVRSLGCDAIEVRTPEELALCDALILPGGESTTMNRLLNREGFREKLHTFVTTKPSFGTCAGLILLAQLGALAIEVERNAYGRQTDSFITDLPFAGKKVEAIFIRAPKISKILSSDVETLASHDGVPVLVRQGQVMGASFHPELTNDPTIHDTFLSWARKSPTVNSTITPTKCSPTI